MHRTVLAVLSLASLSATGCASRAAAEAPAAAIPVALATAAAVVARPAYAGIGTVIAQHTYRVGFEESGRVVAVMHDVGDRVAAGETLAALDTSDYAAHAAAAAARASAAAAAAAKADGGARPQERRAAADAVAAAQAGLERARAAARLADANEARYAALVAGGDVSAQAYDASAAAKRDAAASVRAADAALAQAAQQRSLTDAGARTEDRAAAAAEARAARANAELGVIALRRTRLVAPADADVLSRDVEPGNVAQPGAVAFVLTDSRTPDVVVAVPETHLAGIAPGTPATVAAGGRTWNARVVRVEPVADAATRSANVRVALPVLRLAPGTIVDVALGTQRAAAQARVPLGALIGGAGDRREVALFDAARHTTRRRTVHVRATDGDDALVDGIAPGTTLVRSGAHLVPPGATVRVVGR